MRSVIPWVLSPLDDRVDRLTASISSDGKLILHGPAALALRAADWVNIELDHVRGGVQLRLVAAEETKRSRRLARRGSNPTWATRYVSIRSLARVLVGRRCVDLEEVFAFSDLRTRRPGLLITVPASS